MQRNQIVTERLQRRLQLPSLRVVTYGEIFKWDCAQMMFLQQPQVCDLVRIRQAPDIMKASGLWQRDAVEIPIDLRALIGWQRRRHFTKKKATVTAAPGARVARCGRVRDGK